MSRRSQEPETPPATWSWKKKSLIVVISLSLGVVAAFLGGYLTGRQLSPADPPRIRLSEQLVEGGGHSWKEAVCSSVQSNCPPSFKKSPLLLLSMDGFAAEYLKLHLTPNLEHIMNCGVHPPYMNPMFPSKTFPNHYSIVTGLFPAMHGIIDNTMYDPHLNRYFSIQSPEATKKDWWGGDPIWMTAKRQGLKTATFFWPGSDVNGQRADYYMPYNRSVPFADRIRQIFRWLDKAEEERPEFITVYFEEPDSSGHRYGPQSENVKDALRKVDHFIDILMEGLHLRNLIGCINILIVSDHGMESISCDRVIPLQQLNKDLNTTDQFVRDGTVGRIRLLKNSSDVLLAELQQKLQCKSPHIWVYQQKEFPVRWRYSGNHRIEDLLLDIEPQWLFTTKYIDGKDINPRDCTGGDHGYDNMDEDMWSIFMATGPAFKSKMTVEPFLNVQVYNLMTVLLGIEPSPNNGTFGALFHLLKNPPPYPLPPASTQLFLCNPNNTIYANSSGCFNTYFTKDEVVNDLNTTELAPWGFPVTDIKICLLINSNFLTGYSSVYKSPIWTIYNIQPQLENFLQKSSSIFTILNDPRLSEDEATACYSEDADIIFTPLIITNVSRNPDVLLSSNSVPVHRNFFYSVLKPFWKKLALWLLHVPNMNIVTGPVWKEDLENQLPTHFYFLLTFCPPSFGFNCSLEQLDVLGFVLPHLPSIPSCWDVNKFLEKHQASVDVIEQVTKLRFFNGMPQELSLRLRLKLFQTSFLSISSETKSRPL